MGVCFDLQAPGRDHRRGFSPAMSVFPYQRYEVSCRLRLRSLKNGSFGLFMLTYKNAAATGPFKVVPIKRGPNAVNEWVTYRGTFDVPEGVLGARVMIWSEKQSVCTFDLDDVRVFPVAE